MSETGNPTSLKPAIALVAAGGTLSEPAAEAAFGLVMSGDATPAQIAALVTAMRVRGETVAELTGAVRAMRSRMRVVPGVADAMDVCGTGGDGHGTLNISTAVALVLAGLGVPVAKHGNRAVSSRSGASDVLAALGIPPPEDPLLLERSLQMHGLAFLAAPAHHPALRHAAPVRAELGIRTIFNLLGPLCNPASVRRQMIGVFEPRWQAPIARTLRGLGTECAWVVHGEDALGGSPQGLDEFSLAGPTRVVALEAGRITRFSVEPEALGFARQPIGAIAGGDAAFNAAALERLLDGAPGPYRDTVLLNVAAALQVSGRSSLAAHAVPVPAEDAGEPEDAVPERAAPLEALKEGVRHAARALDEGRARAVLQALRQDSISARGDELRPADRVAMTRERAS